MAKSKDLTLSDVGFGNKVLINGHVYTYQGLRIRSIIKKGSDVKFEIY